jgi:uncharacterized protein (DUF433 family)
MQTMIIDRGRGPEISGTRITVYDILDYLEHQWEPARIASFFQISVEQVQAAAQYIDEHRADVECRYREMLARSARGNPPELRAQLEAAHVKFQDIVRECGVHQNGQEGTNEGAPCGR